MDSVRILHDNVGGWSLGQVVDADLFPDVDRLVSLGAVELVSDTRAARREVKEAVIAAEVSAEHAEKATAQAVADAKAAEAAQSTLGKPTA